MNLKLNVTVDDLDPDLLEAMRFTHCHHETAMAGESEVFDVEDYEAKRQWLRDEYRLSHVASDWIAGMIDMHLSNYGYHARIHSMEGFMQYLRREYQGALVTVKRNPDWAFAE